MEAMRIEQARESGAYLGHGIAADGRKYEGYLIADECRYFDVASGEELPPERKA